MVVPYVLNLIKPKAQRITERIMKKEETPSATDLAKKEAEDEEEQKFMTKVYNEVALQEYNIYLDYAEMVTQVLLQNILMQLMLNICSSFVVWLCQHVFNRLAIDSFVLYD